MLSTFETLGDGKCIDPENELGCVLPMLISGPSGLGISILNYTLVFNVDVGKRNKSAIYLNEMTNGVSTDIWSVSKHAYTEIRYNAERLMFTDESGTWVRSKLLRGRSMLKHMHDTSEVYKGARSLKKRSKHSCRSIKAVTAT